MRLLSLQIATLGIACAYCGCVSAEGYFRGKDRGWFWYEPDPVPEIVTEPEPVAPPLKQEPPQQLTLAPPPPEAPTEEGPPPLSSEWLKANLEKYQFMAMDNPTVDNVAAYLYLQRLMVDKSSAFADAGQVAIAMYPELSNDMRRPRTDDSAMALSRRAGEAMKKVFQKVVNGATLTFVFSSTCGEICDPQFAALRTFDNNTEADLEFLSIDGKLPDGVQIAGEYVNPKRVKELGVRSVPSLYLTTAAGEVVQLSSSIMPYNTMMNSVVSLAYGKGWITHEEYESTKARENYTIQIGADEEVPKEILDDPVKLAVFLRERLLRK